MPFCLKYEIASGSDRKAKNIFVLAADATRKVVKKTAAENVFLSRARGHLRTFGPTYDLDRFRLADPGRIPFFRNTGQQSVVEAPDTPGGGAFWASDATSFSAAAPEKGPFWTESQREHQKLDCR